MINDSVSDHNDNLSIINIDSISDLDDDLSIKGQ